MTIVTLDNISECVGIIREAKHRGIDVETTGLRWMFGARIFSMAIVVDLGGERHGFYFNFWADYPGIPNEYILCKEQVFPYLQQWLFDDESCTWFAHHARFEMHMLRQEGCELKGKVFCTQAMGRVVYNQHTKYGLEESLERIGLQKDPAVEEYITKHGLFEKVEVPGRKQRVTNKFFHKVPFEIIAPYCVRDASGSLDLGAEFIAKVHELDGLAPASVPRLQNVVDNEIRLIKTLTRMEANGCRINRDYCRESVAWFGVQADLAAQEIEEATGKEFVNSAKYLANAFKGHEHEFTEGVDDEGRPTGKWSFDKKSLKRITHPLVGVVLRYRAACNRLAFFQGFLYHADSGDLVHPSFNPDRTKHGRLSSSNPNFQNLKKDDIEGDEEDGETELYVRRAIIPREGNVLLMPDYVGMEYAMALEYACNLANYPYGEGRVVELARRVNTGTKIHKATVELVREQGYDIEIKKAKIGNFLSLYEGGPDALAELLGCSRTEAQKIQDMLARACPELVKARTIMRNTAKSRGWLFNWFGRRVYFPDSRYAYRGPNHVISGGCADWAKLALNNLQDWLDRYCPEALLIGMVHDEFWVDCPKRFARFVAENMKRIMEEAYQNKWVPLRVEMAWSDKSLLDKIDAMPPEEFVDAS